MSASILQERETSNSATGTSTSLAFVSNNTAASAVHALATWGTKLQDLTSITDTNNTYGSVLDFIHDDNNSQAAGQAIAVNIAAGANTVQANYSNTPGFRGILIREIGGVATAPNDGHAGQWQSAPGTGTDACTSGNATNATQPAFMSGLCMNNGGAAPTQGTGFSLGINAWSFGGTNNTTSEHKAVTDTAAKAATFTCSGTPSTLTLMAMFDEPASGATGIGPANIAQSVGRYIGWTV